jgi:Peptidase_C39 like family
MRLMLNRCRLRWTSPVSPARIALQLLAAMACAAWALNGVTPTMALTPAATPTAPPTTSTPVPTPRRATPVSVQRGPAPDLSAPLPVHTAVSPSPTPLPVELPPATATPMPVPPTPTPLPPTETSVPPTPTATADLPTPAPVLRVVAGPTSVPITVLEPEAPAPLAEPDPEQEMAQPAPPAPPAPARSAAPAAEPAPSVPAPATNAAPTRPAAPRRPPANALPFTPRSPPVRTANPSLPLTPGWVDESLLWLGVPSRTQYDGTPYQAANCGPSALGMILEAYGLKLPTAELRDYANYLQGTYGYDDGIALDYLAEIGRRANLQPLGLYQTGGGYRRWSVEDVRAAVRDGYPVIALVVYRLLPGNGGYGGNTNHYVVLDGLAGEDFLYNDSAFGGSGGRGLVISAEQLETAWATADIPQHAVAFAIGDQGEGLLGLDANRFSGGARTMHLLASAANIDPRVNADRPRGSSDGLGSLDRPLLDLGLLPLDLASGAGDAPPTAGTTSAPLLGMPLVGRLRVSLVPTSAAQPLTAEPAADENDAEHSASPARATATAAVLRGLLVLGGVGGLYLLLLVQASFSRLNRAGETPSDS